MKYSNLPGGDILERGLRDIGAGIESIESLLVRIAAPRLKRYGVEYPSVPLTENINLEHALYGLLCIAYRRHAYSRYNSLLKIIVSLENSLASTRGSR